MSYINKELLLVFDFCELTKQYGWVTNIGTHAYGNMAYTRMKIDTHIKKLLDNTTFDIDEICNMNLTSTYKQSTKENDQVINKLKMSYDGKKGHYGLVELYNMHIFDEIYESIGKKIDNYDYNILFLAAFHNDDIGSGCSPIYDDNRFYKTDDGYFLKWPDGRIEKIIW